jgi:hypothetical protein
MESVINIIDSNVIGKNKSVQSQIREAEDKITSLRTQIEKEKVIFRDLNQIKNLLDSKEKIKNEINNKALVNEDNQNKVNELNNTIQEKKSEVKKLIEEFVQGFDGKIIDQSSINKFFSMDKNQLDDAASKIDSILKSSSNEKKEKINLFKKSKVNHILLDLCGVNVGEELLDTINDKDKINSSLNILKNAVVRLKDINQEQNKINIFDKNIVKSNKDVVELEKKLKEINQKLELRSFDGEIDEKIKENSLLIKCLSEDLDNKSKELKKLKDSMNKIEIDFKDKLIKVVTKYQIGSSQSEILTQSINVGVENALECIAGVKKSTLSSNENNCSEINIFLEISHYVKTKFFDDRNSKDFISYAYVNHSDKKVKYFTAVCSVVLSMLNFSIESLDQYRDLNKIVLNADVENYQENIEKRSLDLQQNACIKRFGISLNDFMLTALEYFAEQYKEQNPSSELTQSTITSINEGKGQKK